MTDQKKIRILVFHHCGVIGGAGQSLIDFLDCIDPERYEVTVYTKTADSPQMLELLRKNQNLTVCSAGDYPYIFGFYSGNEKVLLNPWNLVSLKRIRECGRYLRQIAIQEKPDLIIFNTMCMSWAGKALRGIPAKKMIFVRETYGREILPVRNPIIQRQIREDFDQAVYLSEYDRAATGDSRGIVITDKFQMPQQPGPGLPFRREPGKKYILFLGGNSLIKGVETAIHAVSDLPEDTELVIAGCSELISEQDRHSWRIHKPGSDFQRLYQLDEYRKKHGLQNRIHMIGRVSSVNTILQECDLVMIPTLVQHQSRPFIEAGLMKKAAVISRMPCMQGEARDQVNCLDFKIGDASALARQCTRLLNDPALSARLVESNYQWMKKNHDFAELQQETASLLDHVFPDSAASS